MKSKKSKILFWCSFLPYLAVLLFAIAVGIYGAIHGSTFLFGKTYGMKAFTNEFLFTILAFIFMFPVIPAYFFFQVCYFLRTYNFSIQRMPLWLYILCCCILGGLLFAPFLRVWW